MKGQILRSTAEKSIDKVRPAEKPILVHSADVHADESVLPSDNASSRATLR